MPALSALHPDRSFLTSVLHCLRSWWNVDRIRVPNAAGRLLSLETGTRIQLLQQIWNVTTRETKCHEGVADLQYSLTSIDDGRIAILSVGVVQDDREKSMPAVFRDVNEVVLIWDTDVVLC